MVEFRNRKGQDLVEYGALLVIFVMFAILAINAIRSSTGEIYTNVQGGVEGAKARVDQAVDRPLQGNAPGQNPAPGGAPAPK